MASTIYGKIPTNIINRDITKPNTDKIFGVCFPLNPTMGRGIFGKCSGTMLIGAMIKQILLTSPGERVMLPNFGVGLKRFVFEPLDEQTYSEISTEVYTAITRYAPNVEIINLGVFLSDNLDYKGIPGLVIKLTVKERDLDQLIEVQLDL